ncbi:hypothetical protein GZH53_13380 [Flavihumibacter sp. R14]|nr:hypothetical protein [Flavihumibacter soli]
MRLSLLLLLLLTLSACGTAGKSSKRAPKRVVPVAFNIKTENNSELNFVNMDYYRLKILDQLKDFQNVQLTLAEPDEEPEVILNLNIDNFVLWPRDERVSRRSLSRTVQTGTDANGKPVYQTVRATVDVVQVQQRSNARFVVEMTIKGSPGKTYKRSYSPNYNYSTVYADNIQGDSRAVDPQLYFSRGPAIDPETIDFLFSLSNEMVQNVSVQLRSYYRNEQ